MPSSKKQKRKGKTAVDVSTKSCVRISPHSIMGTDDTGNFYASHAELVAAQSRNREAWYAANDRWWNNGGYGGLTDDECMVGDEEGIQDGEEGLAFLDRVLASRPLGAEKRCVRAIDAGAGVGRIAKYILLRRYKSVHLIEADAGLLKRSRAYLGRKRAGRCTFTCSRLEELDFATSFDRHRVNLIWLQWTLQYLTDSDAVIVLRNLAGVLVSETGILVIKENRPFGSARSDRFQMDTPGCSGRYDITRSDEHHRLLFQQAGLQVDMTEKGEETNTYAVSFCI